MRVDREGVLPCAPLPLRAAGFDAVRRDFDPAEPRAAGRDRVDEGGVPVMGPAYSLLSHPSQVPHRVDYRSGKAMLPSGCRVSLSLIHI